MIVSFWQPTLVWKADGLDMIAHSSPRLLYSMVNLSYAGETAWALDGVDGIVAYFPRAAASNPIVTRSEI